jgi:putative peptide zinc metalloprotease protein
VQELKSLDSTLTITESEVLEITAWLAQAGVLEKGASNHKAGSHVNHFNPFSFRQTLLAGKKVEAIGAFFSFAVSRWFLAVSLVLWLVAGMIVVSDWKTFWGYSQKLFVADSALWWIVAWVVLKMFHEIGHAAFAVKYGCRINSAGLSWIFFTPVPYVDLTRMWLNPNRWQRSLCCLGGVFFEVTLSSLAILLFAVSSNETFRYICCLVFTLGTLSTVAVNANPFMKFDGYHLLSEILDWPNLYSDAQTAIKNFSSSLFSTNFKRLRGLDLLLVSYGFLCLVYRAIFWVTLMLGAYLAFHVTGVLILATFMYIYFLLPWIKHYLRNINRSTYGNATRPSILERLTSSHMNLLRIILCTLSLPIILYFLPSPWQPTIPGVIAYHRPHILRNEAEGFVNSVRLEAGTHVRKGDVLAVLSNPNLEIDYQLKHIEVTSLREQSISLRSKGKIGESQSIKAKLEAAEEQLLQLDRKRQNLSILSPCDGKLVDWNLPDRLGHYLDIGQDIGLITETEQLEVIGYVAQTDIALLKESADKQVAIRFANGNVLSATLTEIVPRASDQLDAIQLAAIHGGPLTVTQIASEKGSSEMRLPSPRIPIKALLAQDNSQGICPGQIVGLTLPSTSTTLLESFQRLIQRKWNQTQPSAL